MVTYFRHRIIEGPFTLTLGNSVKFSLIAEFQTHPEGKAISWRSLNEGFLFKRSLY